MPVLIYLYVTLAVALTTLISGVYQKKQRIPASMQDYKKYEDSTRKVPWLNITIIAGMLGLYSKSLGLAEGLVDRISYVYNFYFRYPIYYSSPEALLEAKTEPGIIVISMLVAKLTDNALWLFFVVTMLSMLINLYVISKLTIDYTAVILILMLSMFFLDGIYLVKQMTSIAFANLAFYSYVNGKRIRYLLYSVIACLFHSTAVILFVLYFVYRFARAKKVYAVIFFLFSFLFIYLGPLLSRVFPSIPFVRQYLEFDRYGYSLGGGSTAAFIKGIPFYIISGLSIHKREALKKELKQADIFIIACVLYSMCWLFTFNMYWFYRIGWYLMLPALILIPALYRTIKDQKAHLFLLFTGLLIMAALTLRQLYLIL